MEEFCVLILVAFFVTNSLDKAESVQFEELEELPLQTFDELFVEEWWDKDEAEDLEMPPTNFGQNVHHQIARHNTQIGQMERNSTDQNPPLTESDHSGQIEPNSTDQNPPLTESDQSDNANSNENVGEDEQKRKIIDTFHEMKDKFKQKGKYSKKEWTKIEVKIAKHLKVNRKKIYEWKKEFGLSQKKPKNELIKKFDQMKAELKRAGFKNSYSNQINETVAKELGISFVTIYNWKRELGQTKPKKYTHSEQKELMKRYYEINDQNLKMNVGDIAKMLNIGLRTLVNWKRQFKRQHCIQILLMDIQWKRMPRQMFRQNLKGRSSEQSSAEWSGSRAERHGDAPECRRNLA